MSVAIWMGVGALAIAAGTTAYSMATAPGSPNMQAPPPPANSVQYDDNGEVISSQTWNPAINKWEIRGRNPEPQKPATEWASKITGDYAKDMQDPTIKAEVEKRYAAHVAGDPQGVADHSGGWRQEEYGKMYKEAPAALEQYKKEDADYQAKHAAWQKGVDERKADKQKLADLRTKMLDNLNTTPEDRVKAYAEYQNALSNSAHSEVDPRFAKIERSTDEQANATGMFGSRAYVDTKAELAKDKLKVDTDIATGAAMGKEQLAANDRAYWAGMLNQIDNGARADNLAASQISKNASDVATQQYAGVLGQAAVSNSNIFTKWQADQARSASYANAGTGLAGGLLYLYGNKSGGKTA